MLFCSFIANKVPVHTGHVTLFVGWNVELCYYNAAWLIRRFMVALLMSKSSRPLTRFAPINTKRWELLISLLRPHYAKRDTKNCIFILFNRNSFPESNDHWNTRGEVKYAFLEERCLEFFLVMLLLYIFGKFFLYYFCYFLYHFFYINLFVSDE